MGAAGSISRGAVGGHTVTVPVGYALAANSLSGDDLKRLFPFSEVEKLCRRDHFWKEPQEYQRAVEEAIKFESLDILEILLPAGNSRKLLPLHLAANLGRLEVIELLISCGFDPLARNKQDQLPLHCAATNRSQESALVTTFLCLCAPRALTFLDIHGQSPLHVAIQRNNVPVLSALLLAGAKASMRDGKGRTCEALARELNRSDILTRLQQSAAGGNPSSISAPNKEVDMARIMQVWEKFFENAMRGAFEEGESYDNPGEAIRYLPLPATNVSQYCVQENDKSARRKNTSGKTTAQQTPRENTKSQPNRQSACNDATAVANRVQEWFAWILRCDAGSNAYYVVHKFEGLTRWLPQHQRLQRHLGFNHRDSTSTGDTNEDLSKQQLPESLEEAASAGWLSYYNEWDNDYYWVNVITWRSERYLPLGGYTDGFEIDLLAAIGLETSVDNPAWVRADSHAARAWVFVPATTTATDSSSGKQRTAKDDDLWSNWETYDSSTRLGGYYFNRVTGDSRWEAPEGWNEQIQANGGWILCSSEADDWALYWWDPDSNDVLWAETES